MLSKFLEIIPEERKNGKKLNVEGTVMQINTNNKH